VDSWADKMATLVYGQVAQLNSEEIDQIKFDYRIEN
jgi:geranylgeranyl pyrophosphate synthase